MVANVAMSRREGDALIGRLAFTCWISPRRASATSALSWQPRPLWPLKPLMRASCLARSAW